MINGEKSLKNTNSYNFNRDIFANTTNMLIAFAITVFIVYKAVFKVSNPYVSSNLILCVFVCLIIRFIEAKTGRYRLLSIILVGYVEIFLLPVFSIYGIEGSVSAPIWYAAFIIIMMFILERRDFWWVFILVLYWDTYLFTNTYVWNDFNPNISNSRAYFYIYAVSFFAIAVALNIILLRIEHNYNKAENEIDKSREIEKNARIAKSRFLANMSHEIRTPMNSIIGLSELILKDEMDDITRNEVNIVKQSSYDLLEVIDDVLMYSKLDAKKVRVTNVEFCFDDLLNRVLGSVAASIGNKDLKMRVKVDHNIPKVVFGDDIRIKQVFMSLVFISLALTDNGRLMLSVLCDRDEEKKVARFNCVISDTGCGLSKYDLDAIYGAYDTYDSRQNSNLKGIGLKYSICREILYLIGGTMDIHSIEGVGLESCFSFECGIVDPEPMIFVEGSEDKRVLIYSSDNREYNTWKSIMEGFRISPDYVNSYFSLDRAIQNRQYDFIFVPDTVYHSVANVIASYNLEASTYVITGTDRSYGDFDKCRIVRHPVSSLSMVDVLNNHWKEEDYTIVREEIQLDAGASKILVVDDNAVNLKVAQGIFKTYNVNIDTARSGEEALKLLNDNKYDLVFMDMVMPELSGEETLRRMRISGVRHIMEVPVIALTANTGGNIKQEVLEKGFQEYIAKPIKKRYLTQCLTQFLPPDKFKNIVVATTETVAESNKKTETKVTSSSLKKEETAKTSSANQEKSVSLAPDVIDFEKGLKNMGNSKEVFATVLNTFIRENTEKSTAVFKMLEDNDIKLVTTTVHGIKSSLASIGADACSKLFFNLEDAGKKDDVEYIKNNLQSSVDSLMKVIAKVRDYLGISSEEEELKKAFDEATIKDLKAAIGDMNLLSIREFIEVALNMELQSSTKKTVSEMDEAFKMYDFNKLKELSEAL